MDEKQKKETKKIPTDGPNDEQINSNKNKSTLKDSKSLSPDTNEIEEVGNKKKETKKQPTDAVLQEMAQKDFAESLLSKRSSNEMRPHKNCVLLEEFNSLKEDFRVLKEDFRRLKRKVIPNIDQLTEKRRTSTPSPYPSTQSPYPSTPSSYPSTQSPYPSTPSPYKPDSEGKSTSATSGEKNLHIAPSTSSEAPSTSYNEGQSTPNDFQQYNTHSISSLEDSIAHSDELYNSVKILMLKLFPRDYILTHSVTGKPSNSKVEAKPQFDPRLYNIFLSLIKKKFGSATKDVTAKVHSVQRWVQKNPK